MTRLALFETAPELLGRAWPRDDVWQADVLLGARRELFEGGRQVVAGDNDQADLVA